MRKENNTMYGINPDIEKCIRNGKPFTMILRKGIIHERIFRPISNPMEDGTILYRHEKNTYHVTISNGKQKCKLIDREELPNTSSINNKIFVTIKALELNGYKLVNSNWKVI